MVHVEAGAKKLVDFFSHLTMIYVLYCNFKRIELDNSAWSRSKENSISIIYGFFFSLNLNLLIFAQVRTD